MPRFHAPVAARERDNGRCAIATGSRVGDYVSVFAAMTCSIWRWSFVSSAMVNSVGSPSST
jgi:hypothetical protein